MISSALFVRHLSEFEITADSLGWIAIALAFHTLNLQIDSHICLRGRCAALIALWWVLVVVSTDLVCIQYLTAEGLELMVTSSSLETVNTITEERVRSHPLDDVLNWKAGKENDRSVIWNGNLQFALGWVWRREPRGISEIRLPLHSWRHAAAMLKLSITFLGRRCYIIGGLLSSLCLSAASCIVTNGAR